MAGAKCHDFTRMKLYINGDSHAAAAEAANHCAFAEDDHACAYLGRAPHPQNWQVSWGKRLGELLQCVVHTDAESASSNARILRTTRDWMQQHHDRLAETVMVIQWSTWEREEWLIDGRVYQVTASGIDDVPLHHQDHYRQWILDLDYAACARSAHQEIWQLHQELQALEVRHVFFNGNNHFGDIDMADRHDWGSSYIGAYDRDHTYDMWLKRHGYHTVAPDSWHFGRDAHAAWAKFVLQYGIEHRLWR